MKMSIAWRRSSLMWWVILMVSVWAGMAARADQPEMTRAAGPFPRLGEYLVLRGDFHMHTPHSDGQVAPRERVIEAKRFGYDVIAITDHGKIAGYEEARDKAKELGVLLLPGIETGLRDKEHLVGLDFAADFSPRDSHRWSDAPEGDTVFYREQWRHLHEAGGFVIYAHPHVGLREPVEWAIGEGLLHGIEVKNDVVGAGWDTRDSHGTHWYPFALDWADQYQLTVFANSDVHGARTGDQAITLVLARERTADGVMEALRARRTVAWFNGLLCAPEEILELLVNGLVKVRFLDATDGTRLLIENVGPVRLSGVIQTADELPVELDPYGRLDVPLSETHESIRIQWRNLWIRAADNLTTTHAS